MGSIPPRIAVCFLLLLRRHGEQPLAGPLLAPARRYENLKGGDKAGILLIANSKQIEA